MKLTPHTLLTELQSMPACQSAVVGLSGGLDSVVLLHNLVTLEQDSLLPFALRALHVNHGLHPDADRWQQHCEALCREWGVACSSIKLDLSAMTDAGAKTPVPGLENAARDARYQAFTAQLAEGEALLLAHHRDDQMETLLLRLLRGAGPKGLAGIPLRRALGNGFLYRPLLHVDRLDLHQYAQHHGLNWIEDDANAEQQFDRNYVRHSILPLVASRWPGYRESWSKSAALQSEADALLGELAAIDLQQVCGAQRNELALDAVAQLSHPRQRNLLRRWLVTLGLPEPGWSELHQLIKAILSPVAEGNPTYSGDGYSVTRFKNRLAVLRSARAVNQHSTLTWDPLTASDLALEHNGYLRAAPCGANGTDDKFAFIATGPLQVRYRQGGETCKLRGRPGKSLKKILQEAEVEPWYRERLPLIYMHGELVCIPGIGVAESAVASVAGQCFVITWEPPDLQPGSH